MAQCHGRSLLFGMRNLETLVLALSICKCVGLVLFLHDSARPHGPKKGVALAAVAAPPLTLGALAAIARAMH